MSVRCPYNPQHIMPPNSLLNHLDKCQSDRKHLYTKCKYNLHHIILKTEIQKHQKICGGTKYQEDSEDDWGVETPIQEVKNNTKKTEEKQDKKLETTKINKNLKNCQSSNFLEEQQTLPKPKQEDTQTLPKPKKQQKPKNFDEEDF